MGNGAGVMLSTLISAWIRPACHDSVGSLSRKINFSGEAKWTKVTTVPVSSAVIPSQRVRSRLCWAPAVAAVAVAGLLFQFYGNAARGYIDTRSLFYWWGYQWFDPGSEAQHGPLIVLVAVVLFIRNLRDGREKPLPTLSGGKTSPPSVAAVSTNSERGVGGGGRRRTASGDAAAGWLITAAIGLHVLGYAMQQTRLSIVALLVFVAGALRLAGGKRWSDAAIFPLGLVLLAIPLGFLQPLGFYLRLAVSETAERVLQFAHVPVVRNGTQLFAPDGRFQYDVAAACSGVRSLVALFAMALLIGYVRLPRRWARTLLVLTTVPFAFAGNFLRILAIVGVGQRFGQAAGTWVHDHSGFLVFAVVLGLLLSVVSVWARRSGWTESPAGSDRGGATRPGGAGRVEENSAANQADTAARRPGMSAWRIPLVATLLAGIAVLAIKRIDARPTEPDAGVRIAENGIDPAPLPEFIGTEWIGQRIDVSPVEREVLPPDTGYSRRNYVSIQDRSRQVFVSIVLSGKDRTSIHRPELCVVGQGWNIVEREERTLRLGPGRELPVTLLRIQRDLTDRAGERHTVSCWLAYWFVGREVEVPSHSAMIWRSSLDRLLHFRADRWAYVLAQAPFTAGEGEGVRQIEEVLGAVWPQVRRVRR